MRKLDVRLRAVVSLAVLALSACGAEVLTDSPAAAEWTGPVRAPSAVVTTMDWDASAASSFLLDKRDAAPGYVDIERAAVDNPQQTHWRLHLAAWPPKAITLDATRTVITHGLTFDTTADGVADYVVGISNEAPNAGDLRVWVTNLATGETDEQVGPPYGFPVEFMHPAEGLELGDREGAPGLTFTFLPGTRPDGMHHRTAFYAWATLEEDGEVVGWDYAPDVGWLNAPREADR